MNELIINFNPARNYVLRAIAQNRKRIENNYKTHYDPFYKWTAGSLQGDEIKDFLIDYFSTEEEKRPSAKVKSSEEGLFVAALIDSFREHIKPPAGIGGFTYALLEGLNKEDWLGIRHRFTEKLIELKRESLKDGDISFKNGKSAEVSIDSDRPLPDLTAGAEMATEGVMPLDDFIVYLTDNMRNCSSYESDTLVFKLDIIDEERLQFRLRVFENIFSDHTLVQLELLKTEIESYLEELYHELSVASNQVVVEGLSYFYIIASFKPYFSQINPKYDEKLYLIKGDGILLQL